MVETPRGVRNNNPGNIRKSNDPWQGLAVIQADPDFFQFKEPAWGIRALARLLITYQDKYSCRTVADFIGRWAPPSENDSSAYIRDVCTTMGVLSYYAIDVHAYASCVAMVRAIIQHENGQQPYAQVVLDKGLLLAGIEPPRAPLLQTTTIRSSIVAVAGTVAAAVPGAATQLSSAKDQIAPLVDYADWLKPFFVGVSLLAIGFTMWARVQQRRKGIA